jgi:hypothetical protein
MPGCAGMPVGVRTCLCGLTRRDEWDVPVPHTLYSSVLCGCPWWDVLAGCKRINTQYTSVLNPCSVLSCACAVRVPDVRMHTNGMQLELHLCRSTCPAS